MISEWANFTLKGRLGGVRVTVVTGEVHYVFVNQTAAVQGSFGEFLWRRVLCEYKTKLKVGILSYYLKVCKTSKFSWGLFLLSTGMHFELRFCE